MGKGPRTSILDREIEASGPGRGGVFLAYSWRWHYELRGPAAYALTCAHTPAILTMPDEQDRIGGSSQLEDGYSQSALFIVEA